MNIIFKENYFFHGLLPLHKLKISINDINRFDYRDNYISESSKIYKEIRATVWTEFYIIIIIIPTIGTKITDCILCLLVQI